SPRPATRSSGFSPPSRCPADSDGLEARAGMLRGRPAFLTRGDGEEDAGTLAELAFRPDPAAVRLDETLGDGQPQPGAGGMVSSRLPEGLEEMGQLGGADPRTVVDHAESDAIVVGFHPNHHGAGLATELDRVPDEVVENADDAL